MAIDTDQPASPTSDEDPIARMAALYEAQGIGQSRDTRQARAEPRIRKEAPQQQQAAPESEAAPDDQPSHEPAGDQPEADPAADSDGLVEVEWEGKPRKVEPEVRDALMRHQDYKRKTQDLADLNRVAIAQADQQVAWQEFQKATTDDQRELASVQAKIDAYEKLDWRQYDAQQISIAQVELRQLERQADKIRATLQQKGQELQGKQAENHQKMVSAAYEYIGRQVKGFSPNSDMEQKVASYVESTGMPTAAFGRLAVAAPTIAVWAHKAMQYDALQSGKMQAVRAAAKAPPVLKPGAVGSSAGARTVTKAREALRKSGSEQAFAAALLATRQR